MKFEEANEIEKCVCVWYPSNRWSAIQKVFRPMNCQEKQQKWRRKEKFKKKNTEISVKGDIQLNLTDKQKYN